MSQSRACAEGLYENRMEQVRGYFVSLICVLSGFGILMVYSASITSWPTEFEQVYLSRHLVYLILGATVATICAFLPSRFWFRYSPALFAGCVILLVLVLVPGLGTKVNGAQRWLRLGLLSLQPSELAKIALPLFVCRLITTYRDRLTYWWSGTVPILLPVLLVIPLVIVQPDLGTALFLLFGCGIALLVGSWPMRNFLLSGAAAVPCGYFLVELKPYQMHRITGFLDAWSDWTRAPYQLKQSLISLGAGGFFGSGLGKGWQKLGFVPEANTDFVFAVVGEELGLLGTLGLIALWVGLFLTGVRALSHLDRYSFEAIAGLTLLTQVVMQAALNVAIVTGMVPPKGIPHPLLSYGGSNLIISLVSLGIVISFSRSQSEQLAETI
jgi:cell division protein FtsW